MASCLGVHLSESYELGALAQKRGQVIFALVARGVDELVDGAHLVDAGLAQNVGGLACVSRVVDGTSDIGCQDLGDGCLAGAGVAGEKEVGLVLRSSPGGDEVEGTRLLWR